MDIIDRRLNPSGKNRENIRRYLDRHKEIVRKAVVESLRLRDIKDIAEKKEFDITVPTINEPAFRRNFTSGKRHFILAGNHDNHDWVSGFSTGDRFPRPPSEEWGGPGSGGRGLGDSQDTYTFTISAEEFIRILFDDLELPDAMRKEMADQTLFEPQRTGLANDGSPSNLDLGRSARKALGRRLALGRPKNEALRKAEEEVTALAEDDVSDEAVQKRQLVQELRSRRAAIPWMDPVDFRYKRFSQVPKPNMRAVMFCLMDVSGSMGEEMKDLAKRFFVLLYMFLEKKYQKVDIVYIRHTEKATEVDKKTFFTDPLSGGTVVSSALEEMKRIIKARYPASLYNVYAAQASDGDNAYGDDQKCDKLMDDILPLCQHFAYIEVGNSHYPATRQTVLWKTYEDIKARHSKLAMRRVKNAADIAPVFADLFKRRTPDNLAALTPTTQIMSPSP